MTPPNKELDSLGVFVHGALASLHALGVVYNARRGNWWDVVIHSIAVVYDTSSALKHSKRAQ